MLLAWFIVKEWIALMDISIVHSACRVCMRAGDLDRKNIGEVVTGPFIAENNEEMNRYSNQDALSRVLIVPILIFPSAKS